MYLLKYYTMDTPINKYNNGKIYMICSNKEDITCKYYGSTIKTLFTRMSAHKSSYKRFMNGKCNSCASYELFRQFGIENFHIELVETVNCNSKEELLKIESVYIRGNDCVNKNNAFNSKEQKLVILKEYREANKEKSREYREANKEKQKEFYETNKYKYKLKKSVYYEANKDLIKEKKKAFYDANKDRCKEKRNAFYEANKEHIKQQRKDYREANKGRIKEQRKKQREANKECINEKQREQRKANKLKNQLNSQ